MSASNRPDAANPERASRWEDVVDIFYAPTHVFARRENDRGIRQILIIAVVSAWLFFAETGVLQPASDADFARQRETVAAGMPEVPAEDIEALRGTMRGVQVVLVLFTVPVFVLLVGGVTWLAGKAMGSQQRFQAAIVVAAYAYAPMVLKQASNILQGFVLEADALDGLNRVSAGPARFLDPDTTSEPVLAFAGAFDVFLLWQTALLAIGLSVTGRLSRLRAGLAAGAVWMAGMLFPMLFGMLT
jgi:hypothetical protein